MTNTTVDFLAQYYNMTIHTYERRDYMLEVNPKYTDPSYRDYLNVIDARWIDYETGLFIDITAIRPHETKPNILCSKDQHEEQVCVNSSGHRLRLADSSETQARDLFPLRDSVFEGQMVKIPYDYTKILAQEYGKASLTKTQYSGYVLLGGISCAMFADDCEGITSIRLAWSGNE